MSKSNINNVYRYWEKYFSAKVKKYGNTLQGIGYWDEMSAIKRKELILTILKHMTNKEILDVGGVGDLTRLNLPNQIKYIT